MSSKVLIVEDQFVEANDIQIILRKAGYEVCGIARSVPIAQSLITKEQPDFVLLDIFLKGKLTGIDLAWQLKEQNIPFIYLSANSNEEVLSTAKMTEPYGFVVKPFREKDLLVTLEIARYRHDHSRESRYRREEAIIEQIKQVVNEKSDWSNRHLRIGKAMQQQIPFDLMAVGFDKPVKSLEPITGFLRTGFDEYQTLGIHELVTITGATIDELSKMLEASHRLAGDSIYNNEAFESLSEKKSLEWLLERAFQVQSMLTYPVQLGTGETYRYCFYSRKADAYSMEHIELLQRMQDTLLRNIEDLHLSKATTAASLDTKNSDSHAESAKINAAVFSEFVGNSHLMLNVFDQVTQVAPFNTSVLLLGESGTGKERIADYIHQLSPRRDKPMIKVNCSALPATLIESELFGHEKGAFTGAIGKRIGRFEQADGGSILLDEIGEMPIDLQVKLLRVLQEKIIEPLGSTSSIKVDVRIIAATNKNLEKEVAEGRFRLDLYYRLNVFPIVLPPLRERTEDIPALTMHFINLFSQKSGKRIEGISGAALKKLAGYHWPGNIRELEHFIERSVLLAKGNNIEEIAIPQTHKPVVLSSDKTIHENERDHIMNVLRKCNGKIWGAGGAAEKLNVPPSTLKSKMKKLGIRKEDF